MNIKKLVMSRLALTHGWKVDTVLDTFVTKEFPTAVGLKQASVWISEGNAQHLLNGVYWSEGRNALAQCIICIRNNARVPDIEAQVDGFVSDVNKTVAETYAARLLACA